ncbi:MAG: class I SAM-dependent RNA methyltransferase [Desulfobacteraceae bacterium]|nr:MAG: class I SAM-dependent RNA methyltransferase [Desulfobacteraceae bacterium]
MKTIRKSKQEITRYRYQTDSTYFAQISDEIKDLAVEELERLGAGNITAGFRGIHFQADQAALYRIHYATRVISRIVAPLISFECKDSDRLYQEGKTVRWEDFFTPETTFAVSANVSDSHITHSKYAALRLKDAIVDYFREKTGTRPNVDTLNPDLQLNLHIRHNLADIGLDTSGGPLHKRGYREEAVTAPMQETIAAAIIRHTQWDGTTPLIDPMCGSGTLLCEALMKYSHIPPGFLRRKFGFESLPDFNRSLWLQTKKQEDDRIRPLPRGLIYGSDISGHAVRASKINLMGLPHGNQVVVEKIDFREIPVMENRMIVTNPPYGIRMGKNMNLDDLYKSLGDFLKQRCKGSTAYIYFGDREFIKKIGLKASWKKPIKTGGLDGRLVKFEMY